MSNQCNIVVRNSNGNRLSILQALAKHRAIAVLLYLNDLTEEICAACHSRWDLPSQSKKIGEIFSNIEVHTFGLDDLPDGSTIELSFAATDRDALQKSIDQLSTIQVRIAPDANSKMETGTW